MWKVVGFVSVVLVVLPPGALLSSAQEQPKKSAAQKPAAWVEPDKSEPEGMKYRTFKSKSIDGDVSYLIYLPPDYDKNKDQRYPVVYWLHGRVGSQTGAGQLAGRLDKAIKAGKAPPMIVVGVNGMRTSSYVDSADGKMPVQSVIVKDLIPHIDATYRTIAKREGRAIEGFSMGGAGAPKIGCKYPELFGTVSILGGALHDLESYKTRGTAFQDIYGGKEEYFQTNSPWKLVEKNADAIRGKTSVRIVVGDKDNLLGRNRGYHDLLDKLKIGHEFHVIKDVGHAAGPLYDGLGDKNWQFYTQAFAGAAKVIRYTGDGSDLQKVINEAPAGATLIFDDKKQLEFSTPITINKALTVAGLNARLPKDLGKTMMLVVAAEGVVLRDLELHGNYDSVPQNRRAPLVWVQKGRFQIERCKFYDGTKDGLMVTPVDGGGDIVGGVIKDIEAFRMGRDAISISGGNAGLKVRNVTVENVSLKRGYLRGAVEVSDGTDSITVRRVYAEEALYAIDVQDHGEGSAPNTKITVEDVEAVNCKHILRTANSERGHADLTLRRMTGKNCQTPVQISNTKTVLVEDLTIINDKEAETAPIRLKNCHGVRFTNVTVRGLREGVEPLAAVKCTDTNVKGFKRASVAGDAKWQIFSVKTEDDVKTPALWTAPGGKGPFPVVVFFHGAPGGIGEEGLRKIAAAPRWQEFLQAGYLVCVADYRGHPQGKPFEALRGKVNASDDAVAVIRHLKSLPRVDAKRVGVMGGSLGGAVTLEVLGKEEVVCAVLNAPATFPFLGYRGRLDGNKDRELNDDEIDKKGALARIEKINCPVLIVQGTADGLTPLNHKLAALLKEGKKAVRLERFEGQGHGFTNGPDGEAYRKALKLTVEFIGKHAGTTAGGAGDPKGDRKFAPLFDGKTLDGWVVRAGKAAYKVEDGAIVGTTVESSPNTFLCTKKEYGDFELTFEVKCDAKLNSGVQVRSHAYAKATPQPSNPKRIRPAGDVYGPQVEISADGNAGRIWDEARHARWHDPEPNEKARTAYKPDEWNRYRIVAQGDRIRTWVNDVPVADIRVKEKEDAAGFLGLQVHSIKPGTGPYQVRWRNLQIRELKPDEKID